MTESLMADELKKLSDETYAKQSQKFFKTGPGEYAEGDQFLGIRMPILRKIALKYKNLSWEDLNRVIVSPYHEMRMTGILILVGRYHNSSSEHERLQIYRFYVRNMKSINNWDLVDVSAHKIIGPELEFKDRSPLYQWAQSKHLWTRRISIVSCFHFIRNNDFNDCYAIAKILMHDKHDLIHKAVGWALRECGKKDIELLKLHLKRHYQVMPRTMLRYSIEKFPEKQRLQYLKGQI